MRLDVFLFAWWHNMIASRSFLITYNFCLVHAVCVYTRLSIPIKLPGVCTGRGELCVCVCVLGEEGGCKLPNWFSHGDWGMKMEGLWLSPFPPPPPLHSLLVNHNIHYWWWPWVYCGCFCSHGGGYQTNHRACVVRLWLMCSTHG